MIKMRDGLTKGKWLVIVDENSSSATTRIDPDFIELYAASHEVKEKMAEALHEKSKLRPSSQKISKKEQKAWEAYKEIMGEDVPALFEYASVYEIVEAGIDVLIEQAKCNKKRTKQKKKKTINPIYQIEV
jgi:hypothetical protein